MHPEKAGSTDAPEEDVDFLKIAYLINQFPKVSHNFIYQEIQALERRSIDRAVEPIAGLFAPGSLS
jgi:hypothetical protein